MTEEEALARLVRLVAPAVEPLLDAETLADLLLRARRSDSCGRLPSDPEWVPTWNLDAAASAGWEIKAGLAAGDYNFAASGQRFDRSQVHRQCLKMAEHYNRGDGGSVAVSSGTLDAYVAAVLSGDVPGAVTQ